MRRPLAPYLLAAILLVANPPLAHAWTLFGSEFSKPTELHRAAEHGDMATLRKWIENGRNLDVKYNDPGPRNWHEGPGVHGQTALMFAAKNRQLEAVKLLVNSGANIYLETSRPQREGYEYTVFDYAVEGGVPEIVKYLWEISDKKSFRKRTPINLLMAYDRFCSRETQPAARDLVVFILENLADDQLASDTLWRISDRAYCADEIRFLLERGIAPASSAIITASSLGLSDIVSLYLQYGADINALGRSSYTYGGAKVTPLIAAAGKAHLKTIELLLSAGADPNKQDTDGRTALIAAVAEGGCSRIDPGCEERHEVMKALLKRGARTDLKDRFSKTAFDYADWYVSDPYNDKKKAILNQKP